VTKDFDPGMPAPNPDLTCSSCGAEIDPGMCWCGDSLDHNAGAAGHTPVPMGCKCWTDDNVALQLQLKDGFKTSLAMPPPPASSPQRGDDLLIENIYRCVYEAGRSGGNASVFHMNHRTQNRVKEICWPRHSACFSTDSRGEYRLLDFPVIINQGMPDNLIELRDRHGSLLGRIENRS
jgi:hypothetical protein